jgi:hypothetical protein
MSDTAYYYVPNIEGSTGLHRIERALLPARC